MSTKTKIVVLHMKNLIITGILIGICILLLLLLCVIYLPHNKLSTEAMSDSLYTPGIYTSEVQLGDEAMDIQVTVDKDHINSISLVNTSETIQTMYPLVKPALADLAKQILEKQSTQNLTNSENNSYTSIILINAVNDALKRPVPNEPA